MITTAHLVEEMSRRGRPVTARRLVDWRRRELLPPLVVRGAGRGRGVRYAWPSARVLDQAEAVDELISGLRRVSRIYLPLWLLGFDVPVRRVRAGVVRALDGLRSHLEEQTHAYEDPRDLFFSLAADVAPAFARHYGLESAWFDDYAYHAITALAGHAELIDPEEVAALAGREGATVLPPEPLRAAALSHAEWTGLARHFSLPKLESEIARAPDTELIAARDDLSRLSVALWRLAGEPADVHGDRLRVVAALGPPAFLAALLLRASPARARYEEFIAAASGGNGRG